MRISDLESVPLVWDDARETPFFRITAGLFPRDFCEGASALLAENDDETAAVEEADGGLCRARVAAVSRGTGVA